MKKKKKGEVTQKSILTHTSYYFEDRHSVNLDLFLYLGPGTSYRGVVEPPLHHIIGFWNCRYRVKNSSLVHMSKLTTIKKKDLKTFTSAGLAAATPLTAGCSVSAGATGSASGAVPFTLAGETAGGG